jgi:hypothetical protein
MRVPRRHLGGLIGPHTPKALASPHAGEVGALIDRSAFVFCAAHPSPAPRCRHRQCSRSDHATREGVDDYLRAQGKTRGEACQQQRAKPSIPRSIPRK